MATATVQASIVKPVTVLSTDQNTTTLALNSAIAYTEETRFTLSLGTVTDSAVNFGTVTSAKLVMLRPTNDITIKINGSATAMPISGSAAATGWFLLSNPTGGVTAITVTTTTSTNIEVLLLE